MKGDTPSTTQRRFPLMCLTVTAPYSWLLAGKLKRYETRSWARSYRGLLGIHTARGLGPVGGPSGLLDLCAREPFRTAMEQLGIKTPLAEPRGAIIAVANLTQIHTTEHVLPIIRGTDEEAFGNYDPGRFALQFTGMCRLRVPIFTGGAQQLWHFYPSQPLARMLPDLLEIPAKRQEVPA